MATKVRDPDPAFALRAMTAADIAEVVAVERDSYAVPWTDRTFRGLVDRPDADAISAVAGGAVVGFAIAWTLGDQAELGNVAVARDWRRQGVGESLVRDIVGRLARRGVREVFLEVRVGNESARRLYERLGFVEIGRRKAYYVRPVEDAIVMRKRIRPRRESGPWAPLVPG
jgi:ribosomal-protein-alanine N-acetyltransferase